MLEWSAHYPLAQILWGALCSELFGFSFAVLRLSTLILAWGGLVAFYLTLREMGIRPLPASLGTVVLLCNPVLFMLSHSFMTDVPFVSVMNGSLLFYVRWTKRGHTHDLALGSALAVVAFLIRQLGAALALAPIGYVLLMRLVGGPPRILTWPQRLCLLMPFVGLGLTLGWIRGVHGGTRVYQEGRGSQLYLVHVRMDLSAGVPARHPASRTCPLAAHMGNGQGSVVACPHLGYRDHGNPLRPLSLASGRAAPALGSHPDLERTRYGAQIDCRVDT